VLLVDPPGAAQAVDRKMSASSMSKDEKREVLFALCAFMTIMFRFQVCWAPNSFTSIIISRLRLCW
ncbi:MAG TPA: hypothetical protein DEV72_23115, partial [Ktedonobacter sp.]|nr:hypothetical protein [Ktedonobacter sp.]